MAVSPQQQLAELGFAVFPCVRDGKRPATKHGLLDATTDSEQIERWTEQLPGCNWALRTDGLLVIDVDGADNAWFADLGDKARELSAAQISMTPRGGRHFIFRQPGDVHYGNTQSVIGEKVDTRADGGYIIVAPSTVDGKPYKWLTELDVGPSGLPLPPQWVLNALTPRGQATSTPRSEKPCVANAIPESLRNKTLFSLGCGMRRAGMSLDAIQSALRAENATRCNPALDDREVLAIAESCSKYPADWQAVSQAEHMAEQIFGATPEDDESKYFVGDPGEMPAELLRVPGFVSEVMDYCLETAPYPNVPLAFCGALCLQGFLAARKVRDSGDNRTNLYCLGLANSANGKDAPRKVNIKVLSAVKLDRHLGERFSSGEGLQDAMQVTPSMLYQTDEIDSLLQSINKAKDARYEGIMATLLTLYSSSSSNLPIRTKAGQKGQVHINQPSLVVFGTAIPKHYYNALSERMLTNGLFSRMLVIEAGKRPPGQEPRILELPARVLDTAGYWANWYATQGNVAENNPVPAIVEYSDRAKELRAQIIIDADARYSLAEEAGDNAAMAIWGRVNENARKLALIYAISESPRQPVVTEAAIQWAERFVTHQARRMLFMAKTHVSDNPFHELCQKVKRLLNAQQGRQMARSSLLKRLHVDSAALEKVVNTLALQGDVASELKEGKGPPQTTYTLLRM